MAISENKSPANSTATGRKADAFINASALGNIAINFSNDEDLNVMRAVKDFDQEDLKAYICLLIDSSNISVWIREDDEGKSSNRANARQEAFAKLTQSKDK